MNNLANAVKTGFETAKGEIEDMSQSQSSSPSSTQDSQSSQHSQSPNMDDDDE